MYEPQNLREAIFWAIPWVFSGLGVVFFTWLVKTISWTVFKGLLSGKSYRYFISSPILSMSMEDRKEHLHLVNEVEQALTETQGRGKCFNFIREIKLEDKSGVADVKIPYLLSMLRKSKYFVGIYHKGTLSGSHVEAGFALAQSKPSIYFVKSNVKIPSLMEKAASSYSFVKVIRFRDVSEVSEIIRKSGKDLFRFNHRNT